MIKHYIFVLRCLIAAMINSGGEGGNLYPERDQYLLPFTAFDMRNIPAQPYYSISTSISSYPSFITSSLYAHAAFDSFPSTSYRTLNSNIYYTYQLPQGKYNIQIELVKKDAVNTNRAFCFIISNSGEVQEEVLNLVLGNNNLEVEVDAGAIIGIKQRCTITGNLFESTVNLSVTKVG